ncbi:MAG: PilZ domain-containing protein [Bryobacteraceae bacterium]|nr:PilZ domain-containing protein [Bryobacteraceae bacterium]
MKPLSNNWRSPATLVSIDDRRREPREDAQGVVRLFTLEQERFVFEGEMRDVSASGFRLEHTNQRVRSGDEFRFESPYSSGLARVMWNRILDDSVESGFFIVARDPA